MIINEDLQTLTLWAGHKDCSHNKSISLQDAWQFDLVNFHGRTLVENFTAFGPEKSNFHRAVSDTDTGEVFL